MLLDIILAHGHENITCQHRSTIQITKDHYLTKKGDCILAINSDKGCRDLNDKLKDCIKKGKKIRVVIKINEISDSFQGYGHEDLTLLDKRDLVFRKSNFICNRTVLINCSKSSKDLDQNLIKKMRDPDNRIEILFEYGD